MFNQLSERVPEYLVVDILLLLLGLLAVTLLGDVLFGRNWLFVYDGFLFLPGFGGLLGLLGVLLELLPLFPEIKLLRLHLLLLLQ